MTLIFQQRIDALNEAIQKVPEEWRYRWCGPDSGEEVQDWHPCACMGAANCSGNLGHLFTKEEWAEWVAQNPPKIEGIERFIDEKGRYDKAAHDHEVWGRKQKEFEEVMKTYTTPRS